MLTSVPGIFRFLNKSDMWAPCVIDTAPHEPCPRTLAHGEVVWLYATSDPRRIRRRGGAFVALTWRTRGKATVARAASARGPRVAGATTREGGRRGARKREEVTGVLVRSPTRRGEDGGGRRRRRSGGELRVVDGDELQGSSGEGEARTGIAGSRRWRWRRWRGPGVYGGGGIEAPSFGTGGEETSDYGEHAWRKRE